MAFKEQLKDSLDKAEKKPTLLRVSDSTIKIVDDYDLNELNDYELGYLRGQMAYEAGQSVDECLAENASESLEIKKGIESGYYNAVALPEEEDMEEDFSQLVDSYRKNRTKDNFVKVLKGFRKVADDEEKDWDIVQNQDGDFQVGVKYPKSDLPAVKELLDGDPNLEIKGEEDDYVIVGEKQSDSNKFICKSVKLLAKKHGYYATPQGIFDSTGNMLAPVSESLTPFGAETIEIQPPQPFDSKAYLESELNSLLAEEYLAWYAYQRLYEFVHSAEGEALRNKLSYLGEDEAYDHARSLLRRLAELGIRCTLTTPETWSQVAKHIPAAPSEYDTMTCLNSLVSDETAAINHLNEVINQINSWVTPDHVTVELLKHILGDEERHLSDLNDLIADLQQK